MAAKMELALCLETKEQRQGVRLRLDGGFGTDDNINFALWRGRGAIARRKTSEAPVVGRSGSSLQRNAFRAMGC